MNIQIMLIEIIRAWNQQTMIIRADGEKAKSVRCGAGNYITFSPKGSISLLDSVLLLYKSYFRVSYLNPVGWLDVYPQIMLIEMDRKPSLSVVELGIIFLSLSKHR
jgi:hypothetical protein